MAPTGTNHRRFTTMRWSGRALSRAWPLPAFAAWASAWGVFMATRGAGLGSIGGFVLATGLGALLARPAGTRWRRLFVAAGFPLSLLACGLAPALPGWAWLVPLAALASLYPISAWRDAPLFPTPAGALAALAAQAPLPADARVLDAGCGLGHGLQALREAYPQARLHGLERSWPLRLACALRCRWAHVRRGDIWAHDWSSYDLVYLFQRPESMPRALQKAGRELRPHTWLVSLEFEAPGWHAHAALRAPDGRPVWLYRMPPRPRIDGSTPAIRRDPAPAPGSSRPPRLP
jgi:SAM-dependent methyltransferase